MIEDLTPRRTKEPQNVRALAQQLSELARKVDTLSKSASLHNASITGGDGLTVYDESLDLRLRIATDEGAVIAYDGSGAPVARYGLLVDSSGAGQYGIETRNGATWTHVVGATSIAWNDVSSKPSTFPPSSHTHGGGDITSAVANALEAEGSSYAFNNTVGGTQFYAVWVGNNGGFKLGRNTSSARYKENIRDFVNDMSDLMRVRPVIYDRKGQWEQPTDEAGEPIPDAEPVWVEGNKDEFGLIAEELVEIWPEVITYYDHEDGNGPVIDGIRYDLIAARLIPILQSMLLMGRTARTKLVEVQADITEIQTQLGQAKTALTNQAAKIKALEDRLTKAGIP